MGRELIIGRTIYLADDDARTFVQLRKLPVWQRPKNNDAEKNKWSINGYVQLFNDGAKKIFIRSEHF